ncbi:MAG: histidinol-phosphate transaminase [Gammaproteobacteria bacterium]|nr:histidinol-phosphate transaminase [Gammaproteobacteria bacterium]MCP5423766.1 histidinol-phosphate transaminase [Gammaproteobacteria bacterium]
MATIRPADLIRPEIRALQAYPVPDARGLIKLDAMENPYVWPDALRDEWLARLREAPLNRYPDPQASPLKARLRQAMAIPNDAALILGNGSDELIQLVILALAAPGRTVLAPEPSFVMYRMIADFAGMSFAGVPLRDDDFSLDLTALLATLEDRQPAVVFLAYPNNPTGNRFAPEEVERIIAAAPGLVVVDEAYFSFAEHSFLDSVPNHDNLLVMRTVSKMGLAGLRLGLLVGAPDWLAELEKLRLPYNINVLTQISAEFALEHTALLAEQARCIRRDRELLGKALNALPGVTAYPSEANFILFRTPPGSAKRVHGALREAGVLIKDLSRAHALLNDCLRVTVGTPEENQAFLNALAQALRERP